MGNYEKTTRRAFLTTATAALSYMAVSPYLNEDTSLAKHRWENFLDSAEKQSLPFLINQAALDIYHGHQKQLKREGVGTHYGDKSQYYHYTRKQKFTPEQALLMVLLTENQPDISYNDRLREVRCIGNQFENLEQVVHYTRNREQGRAHALNKAKAEKAESTLQDPKRTSCIGLVNTILRQGYDSAERKAEYRRNILPVMTRHQAKGNVLAKKLKQMGWTAVFASPDSRNPKTIGIGYNHEYAAQNVLRGNSHHGITPDQIMVDFNPSTVQIDKGKNTGKGVEDPTKKDKTVYNALTRNQTVLSGFISASGGYHTALLVRNLKRGNLQVLENHWDKNPTSDKVFELTDLDKWDWGSYTIMLPPETILDN